MKIPFPAILMLLGGLLFLFAADRGVEPNPPQPPVPPGERFVLIVHESSERTAVEAATLAGLRRWLEDQSCRYRIVDKDLVEPSGASASWLTPYLKDLRERSVSLPALVVTVPPSDTHQGVYLVATELPGRDEEAIAIVEEALSRE